MASITKRERITKRIEFHESMLEDLQNLAHMMASNDIQSYTIASRNLSRYKNLGEVMEAIESEEQKIDELQSQLNGHRRKAVAVVPRDRW